MKPLFATLAAGLLILGQVGPVTAQVAAGNPVQIAQSLDACNGAEIIDAVFLDTGQLQVTCPRGSTQGPTGGGGALAGTGLSAGAAAGLLLGVIVVAAAAGNNAVATTTTTTTTTSTTTTN